MNPIDTKLLPIPEQPYSRDEIEYYVDSFFEQYSQGKQTNKSTTKYDKQATRSRLVYFFETLPPWAQILLVESHVPIKIGPRRAIALPSDNVGDSDVTTYRVRMLANQLNLPNSEAEYTLAHELSHSIDAILGDCMRLPQPLISMRLSELYDTWATAFTQESKRSANGRNQPLFGELNQLIHNPGYSPSDRPVEAFAIILSQYFIRCFRAVGDSTMPGGEKNHQTKVDMSAIDTSMEIDFPKLWPCFRDQLLPIALTEASEMYALRRSREKRAGDILTAQMQVAIDAVVERYGCEQPDKDLASRLALSHTRADHYFPDWHSLLCVLVEPARNPKKFPNSLTEEPSITTRLRMLFPSIFDPLWDAPLQPKRYQRRLDGTAKLQKPTHFTPRSFPELRVPADELARNFETIIHEEGIERFLQHYEQLAHSFNAAIEEREAARTTR